MAIVFTAWMCASLGFWSVSFAVESLRSALGISQAQIGFLISVTLASRFAGGLIVGTLSEVYGRWSPLLLSMALCATSAGLGSAAGSYAALVVARAAFGCGLGGVWVAGFALALDPLRGRVRGVVSGILQGGWNWGLLIATLTAASIRGARLSPNLSWRLMWAAGTLSSVSLLWGLVSARRERSSSPRTAAGRRGSSKVREWMRPRALRVLLHTSSLMGAFMAVYYALTSYYPVLLSRAGRSVTTGMVALNAGAILGTYGAGRLSAMRIGPRGAVTVAASLSAAVLWLAVRPSSATMSIGVAFLMGISGLGIWGVVPRYLADRFPESMRAVGPGVAYHTGALLASPVPTVIGLLLDRKYSLAAAISGVAACAIASVLMLIWLGEQTWDERLKHP